MPAQPACFHRLEDSSQICWPSNPLTSTARWAWNPYPWLTYWTFTSSVFIGSPGSALYRQFGAIQPLW